MWREYTLKAIVFSAVPIVNVAEIFWYFFLPFWRTSLTKTRLLSFLFLIVSLALFLSVIYWIWYCSILIKYRYKNHRKKYHGSPMHQCIKTALFPFLLKIIRVPTSVGSGVHLCNCYLKNKHGLLNSAISIFFLFRCISMLVRRQPFCLKIGKWTL